MMNEIHEKTQEKHLHVAVFIPGLRIQSDGLGVIVDQAGPVLLE